MAWALWGSIAFEHPELAVRRIDLDPHIDFDRDAAALVDELLRPGPACDGVAHRGGQRATPRLIAAEVASPAIALRPDACYLVTGGLGALGLRVADALVAGGARNLALVGRRPPDAGQRAAIAELERAGARIEAFAVDVADRAAVGELLEALALGPAPLRGIVHAAGVLEDGVVLGHTAAQFARVVSPKIAGAIHLHALTAGWSLDFFVLFSSVAGTLCPPGQASYAAANAGLDAIARQRRERGLPGVSLAWGPWADAGMAAQLDAASRARLARRGLDGLAAETALPVLRALLGAREPHVVVMPIADRARLVAGFSYPDGRPCAILAPDGGAVDAGEAAAGASRGPSLLERLRAAPERQRRDVLEAEIAQRVCAVLGLTGPLRADLPFRQLGMDSLMAVTVRNALAAALDRRLPATILFDHPTVAALADELARALGRDLEPPGAGPPQEPASPGDPPLDADLAFLAGLSDASLADDIAAGLAAAEGTEP
jgi:NAD(P)-dependent dehydrogenase (short-subunit alcohol dehydrogenase family)/acyl carrier protein